MAKRKPVTSQIIIRLLPGVNERLRRATRYRGDLTSIIVDAIVSADPGTLSFLDMAHARELRGTTINIDEETKAKLVSACAECKVSRNAYINAALAQWFQSHRQSQRFRMRLGRLCIAVVQVSYAFWSPDNGHFDPNSLCERIPVCPSMRGKENILRPSTCWPAATKRSAATRRCTQQ